MLRKVSGSILVGKATQRTHCTRCAVKDKRLCSYIVILRSSFADLAQSLVMEQDVLLSPGHIYEAHCLWLLGRNCTMKYQANKRCSCPTISLGLTEVMERRAHSGDIRIVGTRHFRLVYLCHGLNAHLEFATRSHDCIIRPLFDLIIRRYVQKGCPSSAEKGLIRMQPQ